MLNDACYDAPVGTSDHPRTAQPSRHSWRRPDPDEFSAPSRRPGDSCRAIDRYLTSPAK